MTIDENYRLDQAERSNKRNYTRIIDRLKHAFLNTLLNTRIKISEYPIDNRT